MKENFLNVIRLLDDSSSVIQQISHQELLKNSYDLILNKDYYSGFLTEEELKFFSQFLHHHHTAIVQNAFQTLVQGNPEDLELEKAWLILSYWNNPEIKCSRITRKLDWLADQIKTYLPFAGHPLIYLDTITYFFINKFQFQENAADLYNPENYFIDAVLETRRGVSISLGFIFLLVAKRIYFPLTGVPVPGKFMLRFDNDDDVLFFEPLTKDKYYSFEECRKYLRYFNFSENKIAHLLQGVSNSELFLRILSNLKLIYSSYEENPEKLGIIEELIKLLETHYL